MIRLLWIDWWHPKLSLQLRAFDHICMEKAHYKFLIIIIIIIITIIIIINIIHKFYIKNDIQQNLLCCHELAFSSRAVPSISCFLLLLSFVNTFSMDIFSWASILLMANFGFQMGNKCAVYVKLSFTAYTVFSKQHFLLCFKSVVAYL